MQALSDLIDLVSLQRCSEIAIATSLFSLQLIYHVICDVAWERSTDAYFTSSKPGYRATTRPLTEEDKAAFLNDLKDNDVNCPFRWLLSPETTEFIDPIAPPFIEDVLPLFASNRDVFLQKIQVTQEQRKWVAEKTKDQLQNHFWGRYRRLRLTGSNFGKVLQAIERNKNTGRPFPPSLFKSLKGEYNVQKKDAIIWGQMHEKTALAQYQVATGNQVLQSGLQLFLVDTLAAVLMVL